MGVNTSRSPAKSVPRESRYSHNVMSSSKLGVPDILMARFIVLMLGHKGKLWFSG